jgi:hypothetical protein
MYPVLQKYYSALRHAKGLTASGSLFDCISSLDSFLSEFRNITFVMQKQFNSQDDKQYYERLRDKHLVAPHMRWFIDKRNETTKQAPFNLEKIITLEIYSSGDVLTLQRDAITVENDTTVDEIKTELIELLDSLSDEKEVFFSVRLSLQENGIGVDVVNLIHEGIGIMDSFLHEAMIHYPCNCSRCVHVKELIQKALKSVAANRFPFVWDAAIYNMDIKWGSRVETYFGDGSASTILNPGIKSMPVECFFHGRTPSNIIDLFAKLSLFLALMYRMQKMEWMPTFFIVYTDGTMSISTFVFTLKSTLYRKAVEIAEEAKKGEILAVIFFGEVYSYSAETYGSLPTVYEDRVSLSESVMFSCYLIGKSNAESRSLYLHQEDIRDDATLIQAIKVQLEEDVQSQIMFWSIPIQESLNEAFNKHIDAENKVQ